VQCGPFEAQWDKLASLIMAGNADDEAMMLEMSNDRAVQMQSKKKLSVAALRYWLEETRLTKQDQTTKAHLQWSQLPDLLAATCRYRCSFMQDKLYALLSLFTEPIPDELKPDLSKSAKEVLRNVARFLLREGFSE